LKPVDPLGTVEDLHAAASELTGLTDFGPDDYTDGLAVLLSSYERDADLTPRGRTVVRAMVRGRAGTPGPCGIDNLTEGRGGVMDEALALSGRVAIVTGAARGLGRAEALALARAGARLVVNDLPGEAVQAVADQIAAAGGAARVVAGDVAEWPAGERLLAAALAAYGRLDIVVNNAGVLRDRMIFTMSPQEWDLVIRVHLRGHFVTTRLATAHWRQQSKAAGGPVYARIVNTSSEAFLLGSPGQPNYAAAKAGIAVARFSSIVPQGRPRRAV
jgi:NADP-dependent 3-hydroxy acid dehydrogenase YdfG